MKTSIALISAVILVVAALFVFGNHDQVDIIVTDVPKGDGLIYSNNDRDLMIRTVYGEAAREPRLGQLAVAFVIRNRLENPYGWRSISQIVTACGFVRRRKRRVKVCQFEPWLHDKVVRRMKSLRRDSDHYRQIATVVDDVLHGRSDDPTSGAWYFLNQKIVAARVKKGMKLPAFARNGRCRVQIGRHSFCPPVGTERMAKK